jgi:hypothetical protein
MLQAAPFLRQIVQREGAAGASSSSGSSAAPQELSAEQFTLAKEQQMRERGAEIITVDGGYQAGKADGGSRAVDTAYRPKVATWGVFPRPANISQQYGGGRTLKPGEVPHAPIIHAIPFVHALHAEVAEAALLSACSFLVACIHQV